MWSKLTPLAKIALLVIVFGGIAFGLHKSGTLSDLAPGPETAGSNTGASARVADVPESVKTIKVGVVTWGGYAGGQYFNEGFKANTESRFYKDYGFMVEFKVLDDFGPSRDAWKSDEVDLLWATVDAFPTESAALKQYEPKIVFQADWSRGGDAIVARKGINNVSSLKGKKIAVAFMTPSHSFLINLLETSSIDYKDVTIIEVASAIEAAQMFKGGAVDAAVVWSPDDADCVDQVRGSKVLQSTKTASHIIADVFYAKQSFIDANEKELQQLYEGWMKGSAEINSSDIAKKEAAKILEDGLNQDYALCYAAINNVRLTNHGDNLAFFGKDDDYQGVTGEDLYRKMTTKYTSLGYIKGSVPSWRSVNTKAIIGSANIAELGSGQDAEGAVKFKAPTKALETVEAISTKQVTITFPTGGYTLDENTKYIIDQGFVDIAKTFSNARIRIQGNTDNTGSKSVNKRISKQRAQAVADYLINEYGFDRNRFVIVGNGSDKPVADNGTASGRSKNRRTDFELIAQ